MRRMASLVAVFMLTLLIPALAQPAAAQSDPDCDAIANSGVYGDYSIVYAPQSGGSGRQVVLGTDGDDYLTGGSGVDILCGFGGNDVLEGGSGSDILIGGPGADEQYGGSGHDTLYVDGADTVVDGGSGHNSVIDLNPVETNPTIAYSLSPGTESASCNVNVTVTGATPDAGINIYVHYDASNGLLSSGRYSETDSSGKAVEVFEDVVIPGSSVTDANFKYDADNTNAIVAELIEQQFCPES